MVTGQLPLPPNQKIRGMIKKFWADSLYSIYYSTS